MAICYSEKLKENSRKWRDLKEGSMCFVCKAQLVLYDVTKESVYVDRDNKRAGEGLQKYYFDRMWKSILDFFPFFND